MRARVRVCTHTNSHATPLRPDRIILTDELARRGATCVLDWSGKLIRPCNDDLGLGLISNCKPEDVYNCFLVVLHPLRGRNPHVLCVGWGGGGRGMTHSYSTVGTPLVSFEFISTDQTSSVTNVAVAQFQAMAHKVLGRYIKFRRLNTDMGGNVSNVSIKAMTGTVYLFACSQLCERYMTRKNCACTARDPQIFL